MTRRPPQGIRIPTEWEPEIKESMTKRGLKLHAWLRWAIRWALDSEKEPEVPVTLGNGGKQIGTAKVRTDEAGNVIADMNISGPVADAIAAGPFGESVPRIEFVEPAKTEKAVPKKAKGREVTTRFKPDKKRDTK